MKMLKPTRGSLRIWLDDPEVPSYPSVVIRPRRVPARHGGVSFGAARCKARVSSIG